MDKVFVAAINKPKQSSDHGATSAPPLPNDDEDEPYDKSKKRESDERPHDAKCRLTPRFTRALAKHVRRVKRLSGRPDSGDDILG